MAGPRTSKRTPPPARRRLRAAGVVFALLLTLVLNAAPTTGDDGHGTEGADEAACDPRVELCLETEPMWIAPQRLFYRGPAEAGDSLRVRWSQEERQGAVEGELVADDGETARWLVILPGRVAGGRVELTASARTPLYRRVDEGRVRPASAREQLGIRNPDGGFRARFSLRARADVRVIVVLRLRARYPAEGWERVRQWRVARTVSGGGDRVVRVRARKARQVCSRFARCRLQARAQVRSLGMRLAQRRAARGVPTGPERFSGRLGFVPRSTPASGPGRLYRYGVYVERGVKIDRRKFARQVHRTLAHDRGWGRSGRVAFRQVRDASRAGTRLILASPAMVDRLCFPLRTQGYVSCQIGRDVVLNLNRWRWAVPHFGSRRTQYRRMLVNHEFGHRLGHGHYSCGRRGARAPVMQQQTYGLQGCRSNAWPLAFEISRTP